MDKSVIKQPKNEMRAKHKPSKNNRSNLKLKFRYF